jgi:hypothetical protein
MPFGIGYDVGKSVGLRTGQQECFLIRRGFTLKEAEEGK